MRESGGGGDSFAKMGKKVNRQGCGLVCVRTQERGRVKTKGGGGVPSQLKFHGLHQLQALFCLWVNKPLQFFLRRAPFTRGLQVG